MSALRKKLAIVLLLATWFAATQHCGLENLELFAAHGEESAAQGCCKGVEDVCATDGCDTVETGTYKPDGHLEVAAPQFVAIVGVCYLRALVSGEPPGRSVLRRDFERSAAGAPTWHFVQRAALPARAPSLRLA